MKLHESKWWVAAAIGIIGAAGCDSGGGASAGEGTGESSGAESSGAESSGEEAPGQESSGEESSGAESAESGEGAEAATDEGGSETIEQPEVEGAEEGGGGEPEPPAIPAFGAGRGAKGTYTARLIVPQKQANVPMDIGFNFNRLDELWVANIGDNSLTVAEYFGTPEVEYYRFQDQTLHFKEAMITIAFGDELTFGTCGDSDNSYSGRVPPNYFMGPVLWESTIENFEEHNWTNPGGPHLDMLHNSPLCTGIAWESANRFYAVNGLLGSVEWYDFREPHPHGGDDHSDGITRRLVTGVFTRVPGVPSHMELDHSTGWLYLADPGGKRVVRIDTDSGDVSGLLFPNYDAGAEAFVMSGVDWEVFIPEGTEGLEQPSGLAIDQGVLYISDYATGIIHAFELATGEHLAALDTGRGEGALAGIEIGPLDGFLYLAGANIGDVIRLEPKGGVTSR